MPHLFVDISSHGFGHFAQTAPVLNHLAELLPDLHLTVRSGLPLSKLQKRIRPAFKHIHEASDFGFAMIDALRIDHAASRSAYLAAHRAFPERVAQEAQLFRSLAIDAVFSNVAYLPLAGAAQAGLPAASMCSLNWAELFDHFYGTEDWAAPIHAEILSAYNTAVFMRLTPAMPMAGLQHLIDIPPIAAQGNNQRASLRKKVDAGETARVVLVALGGIPSRLPIERWPATPDIRWLVPTDWQPDGRQFYAIESSGLHFTDLLRSVDAIVTKPGYGTFTEAVCNDTPVLYQRREDWPEQECLIDWLHACGRCHQISAEDLLSGQLDAALTACIESQRPTPPAFDGHIPAAQFLAGMLA